MYKMVVYVFYRNVWWVMLFMNSFIFNNFKNKK